jgi:hypothetical protein
MRGKMSKFDGNGGKFKTAHTFHCCRYSFLRLLLVFQKVNTSRFHGQSALINDSTPKQNYFCAVSPSRCVFCVTAYDCSRYLSRFVGPFHFSTPMIFSSLSFHHFFTIVQHAKKRKRNG